MCYVNCIPIKFCFFKDSLKMSSVLDCHCQFNSMLPPLHYKVLHNRSNLPPFSSWLDYANERLLSDIWKVKEKERSLLYRGSCSQRPEKKFFWVKKVKDFLESARSWLPSAQNNLCQSGISWGHKFCSPSKQFYTIGAEKRFRKAKTHIVKKLWLRFHF